MDKTSTTPGDNPTNGDSAADTTTSTDPQPGTDTQPADKGDNLDPSKSTDTKPAADDDKKSEDESAKPDDKKPDEADKGESKDDPPASPFDADLDDWIEKRKLKKPENDDERQALQDLRNEQRDFTREQQAKKDAENLGSEIDKTKKEIQGDDTEDEDDDDDDEMEKTVKELKADRDAERATRLQSEFYTENKVSEAEHKQIMDILKEKAAAPPTREAKLAALDLWSKPEMLPDLLDIARARLAKAQDPSAVADEAAQKERERIARESNANSPSPNASTTTTPDLSEDEARRKRFEARYNK